MQESYDIDGKRGLLGQWIASQLKWKAHQGNSPHLCILTKHGIVETFDHAPWHGVGARVRTPKGELLAWTCWIDYRAYLPGHLAKHEDCTVADLLACETEKSGRAKQTTELLDRLKKLGHLDGKLPLLVGGDWNSPSHLDYGESTKHLHRGLVVPIPTSLAMKKVGLIDTFREVYPDPLKNPGVTWSPLYRTNKETGKAKPMDRIDRLYLRSDRLIPTAATTFPEELEDEKIPQSDRKFPSDHGAVLTTLKWKAEDKD